jgi:hypothetical protein
MLDRRRAARNPLAGLPDDQASPLDGDDPSGTEE